MSKVLAFTLKTLLLGLPLVAVERIARPYRGLIPGLQGLGSPSLLKHATGSEQHFGLASLPLASRNLLGRVLFPSLFSFVSLWSYCFFSSLYLFVYISGIGIRPPIAAG